MSSSIQILPWLIIGLCILGSTFLIPEPFTTTSRRIGLGIAMIGIAVLYRAAFLFCVWAGE